MTHKTATRIIRKIGESHVVWFGESNRWLELREPAWFVYHKHEAGENEESLVAQLCGRYDLPGEEARRFYREIIDGIRISSRPDPKNDPLPLRPADSEVFNTRKYRSRHYLINGKPITIAYGSQELEHYIHRPLAWLETTSPSDNSLHLRAVRYEYSPATENQNPATHAAITGQPPVPGRTDPENPSKKSTQQSPVKNSPPSPGKNPAASGIKYALQVNEETVHHFDDAGFLKHKLYVLITGHIYGIPENDWMSYIHASAVTNGSESILLSSASGSGKSTMAAMLQLPRDEVLQQAGNHQSMPELYFVSDDFVPVDAVNLKSHVFPAALTAKKGSFPVIEGYHQSKDDADAEYNSYKNPDIRYIRPRLNPGEPYRPLEVKKIVFVRYSPGVTFKMEKLSAIPALTLFHEEAWVSHNPDHVRRFVDWFVTLTCYRVEYSDLAVAMNAIRELFPGKPHKRF